MRTNQSSGMRKKLKNRHFWNFAFILLFSIAMIGCQGLSAGSQHSTSSQPSENLGFNTSSLSFGNVVVGSSNNLTLTGTNSGTSALTITSTASSAKEFAISTALPLTIAAGQSASLSIVFTPDSASTFSGSLSIASNASNGTETISLTGAGIAAGVLTSNPTSLGFGTVVLGNTQTKSVTLTNLGDSSVTISQASVSGSGFQISGLSLPVSLDPGQSTNMNVSFKPQNSGSSSGSVVLSTLISMSAKRAHLLRASLQYGSQDSGSEDGTLTINLAGSGQGQGTLSVSPTSLSFSNVEVGKNQSQPATLTNTGSSTLTVSQATVTGAGFSVSGLVLPLSLDAGQSANFSVIFAPQSAGNVSGNVAFSSDASDPVLNLPLSGQALAPGSLTVRPTSLAFGNVEVTTQQSQPATLTNTGGSSVTISQATVAGAGFSISGLILPVTLNPGQNAGFTVTFAPQSPGLVNGSVTFTSNAPNPNLVLPVSGTGVAQGTLSPNPASLNFGSVQVGNNKQLPETVKNTGGSNLTITQDTVTGAGFSVTGLTVPLTLTPGQSYTFTVVFAPQSAGNASGNVTLTSDASNPTLVIPLSGTATAPGQLTINPASLNFGNVVVGNNTNLPASLNASGASVTITSVTSSNGAFTVTGLTLPLTIQAGKNAPFTVTFTPQATGVANGTLTFFSNASNSPTVQNLTGTGTAQHTVALSWTASTSPDVVGYNVYRGAQSGGPYSQINGSVDPNTNYTDNTVSNGNTYYYVTKAVDSNNQLSVYSNEATAVIPQQ